MGTKYLLGNGSLFIAQRDASGNPKNVLPVGNVPELTIALSTEAYEHFESESGQNLQDLNIITKLTGEVNAALEEIFPDNLAFLTNGIYTPSTTPAAKTDTYAFTAGQVKAGMKLKCQKGSGTNVTAVTVTSTPTVTWVLDTQYSLDAANGIITILTDQLTVTSIVVAYTDGTTPSVSYFTNTGQEYYAYFAGINKAQSGKKYGVDLWRVQFDPVQDLALISTEAAKFTLKGKLLADSVKGLDPKLGPYGRWSYVGGL